MLQHKPLKCSSACWKTGLRMNKLLVSAALHRANLAPLTALLHSLNAYNAAPVTKLCLPEHEHEAARNGSEVHW